MTSFTLIELIIVITILAILAAVAIPTFGNLQKQARDTAAKGAAGSVRAALMIYRMNEISTGRSSGSSQGAIAGWPDGTSVRDVQDGGVLAGHVMQSGDLPENPWARNAGILDADSMEWWFNCAVSLPEGSIVGSAAWVYDQCDGRFWANTTVNGETPCNPCTAGCKTENCF